MTSVVDRQIKARERAKTWRDAKREKGLCPKHGTPVSRLRHCHGCQDSAQSFLDNEVSPQPGDQLKTCFRCDKCGRHYHQGTRYHYKSGKPRKRSGIQPGPNNSLFDFDKTKPGIYGKYLSICGECRKEDGRDDWTKVRYRNFSTWPGLCDTHGPRARRLIKDEHVGEKGRGIWLRWSRAIFDAGEVPVEYDECKCKMDIPRSTAISYRNEPPTSGRCIDHQPPPPHKKQEDKHIGEEGRGVWLRFSQKEEQGRVLIEYERCGCSRYAPRQTALAYLHEFEVRGKRVRGMCAKHVIDPPSASDGGQKNGGTPNPRGRKPGDTLINYEEFVEVAKACGFERLRELNFEYDLLKQKDVLIKYHFKCPGDRIAATTFMLRLKNAKCAEDWSDFIRVLKRESAQVNSNN